MTTESASPLTSAEPSFLQTLFVATREKLQKKIIGQEALVERLLIALLADGHLLVEGAPGLAKTLAIKSLAGLLEGDFHRLQFTPDLLPGDLTGTDVYRPDTADFQFQQGPLFHNLVLADEINRAPAKVQSALLEAMGEHQITVGKTTYPLPKPFMVMATQNPIEQEGTYPLPEAQLDRFLMHVTIGYPSADTEKAILALARTMAADGYRQTDKEAPSVSTAQVLEAQNEILAMHMAEPVEEYLVQLVLATRNPSAWDVDMAKQISFGASPRATISLDRCARAHAWLAGRDYVSPEDVQSIAHDVLRHRILLSYEAEAEGISSDDLIDKLLTLVPVA